MARSGELMLQVRVLGPTTIQAGTPVLPIDRPLERALAVRLALARGAAVPDQTLIDDLWGDTAVPIKRLRVLVHRLRRTLGDHADAIQRTSSGYALSASAVDLTTVEEIVNRPAGQKLTAAQIDEALQYWREPALRDLRAFPFGASEGARLDALRLSLRTEAIELKLAAGTADPAELDQLVVENPLHERLVGLSAIALYQRGQRAKALQRMARLRQSLAEQLGIDPTPGTTQLELRILRMDPALAAPALPDIHRAAAYRRTGQSTFVGRDEELKTLLSQLTSSALITLLGGPGMGKTRLAREIAASSQDAGRAIVWLDLAAISKFEAVPPALAAAAGVEAGPGDPLPRSIEKLAGTLLVVDNAEHLVEDVAGLLLKVRREADDLTVLVTSQRPLRISGEEIHQVGPLSSEAAGQLFCSRSGAIPDEQIDLICTAVDRLPLAVELAAGLTRTLTIDQLAERIPDRLRLLVSGNRDAGVRHSSLRAAVNWSHSLLPPAAQLVLRRLAVFAGGCTLEAAEQVASGAGIETADIAPVLIDLSDRCLVTVDGLRYQLLETVRDFALECLRSADEETAVRRRHADWCADLAARTQRYGGSDHRDLLRELSQEEANLRAALDWSIGPDGDPGLVLAIAAPTWWYWWSRGLMGPARDWLHKALELGTSQRTTERAAALRAVASLTRNSGQYAEAKALGEQSLTLYRELADSPGETAALVGLAITNLALEQFETALAQGQQAVDSAEQLGDQRILGTALNVSACVLRCLGRRTEAEQLFSRSHDIWVATDDRRALAGSLNNLALVAQQNQLPDKSRELAMQALRLYRDLDLTEGLLDILELVAQLELDAGHPAIALRMLTIAATQRLQIGAPLFIPDELAGRDHAATEARRLLGTEAATFTTAAQFEPIGPVVDALLGEL